MKKELYQEIEIPEEVQIAITGNKITIKGKEGELTKEFHLGKLEFNKKEEKIIIGYKKSTKRERKMMNTITAHIKNMIKGVQEKFVYQLKMCISHFPFTIEIKENKGIIKNFLGEKIPRELKIPENVEIKIENQIITISSPDKELAGQAAANFERATKIRNKDRRVFQDGIYIINKAGKEI